jgi:hypothetical protein
MINTLSMLEHIGSRKIMATQLAADIDQATLRHVAEEAHHAYFMKRAAEKTAARSLEYVTADLLAPAAARMYFPRLESAMVKELGSEASARSVYLYMSLIVEFRALWFYRLYQTALRRARSPITLKRLIGEEESHLGAVARRLERESAISEARTFSFLTSERKLYHRLLAALRLAVA